MYIMSGKKKEKDGGEGMSVKKRILEVTIFLLVMFLTFYTLFSGKNLGEIANAASKMSYLQMYFSLGRSFGSVPWKMWCLSA